MCNLRASTTGGLESNKSEQATCLQSNFRYCVVRIVAYEATDLPLKIKMKTIMLFMSNNYISAKKHRWATIAHNND